jgi:hypothetical protein
MQERHKLYWKIASDLFIFYISGPYALSQDRLARKTSAWQYEEVLCGIEMSGFQDIPLASILDYTRDDLLRSTLDFFSLFLAKCTKKQKI